jgi:integrase
MAEADRGVAAAAPARLTVAEWLRQWIEITRGEIRPITSDRYEGAVRLYLVPALRTIRLRDLSPRDIQTAFTRWTTAGRYRGTGGLARSTLGLLRETLHAALQRALELELIGRHPMAPLRKRLPTGAAPEAKVIGTAEVAALERAAATAYHPAILLASASGWTAMATVCPRPDGSPINPRSLSAWCRDNLPIGFQGLRHTHASLLLNIGASMKAVSSRLGHSSGALTLGIYAHVLPGADEDAARRIDDLLSGSKRVANQP